MFIIRPTEGTIEHNNLKNCGNVVGIRSTNTFLTPFDCFAYWVKSQNVIIVIKDATCHREQYFCDAPTKVWKMNDLQMIIVYSNTVHVVLRRREGHGCSGSVWHLCS